RRMGVKLALATAGISGLAIFLNGNGVRAYGSAAQYTTAKNLVCAIVLIGVVAMVARGGTRIARPSGARQWGTLAVVAIIGGSIPFVLFFEGLSRATATQAALLHKSLVIWVAILAVAFLRERLTWVHGAAIALLIVGQVGLNGGVAGLLKTLSDSGALMVLGATLLWSAEVVVSKRLLREASPWTLSLARMAGGSVVLVAWSAATGAVGQIVPRTAVQWSWVLLTGVLLAGYVVTWHQALARAQAVDVTAVLVAGALVTAALSGAFKGVSLAPDLWWYGAITAGTGMLLWQMGRRRPLMAVAATA
ncbi:MAG: DMT family transporter, partial [Demequinaceae bacterium]|nr:DMT family transporter [Demequinaceae bacterium]